jgi:ACS family D-galactonate transporter-like MFS transporter
MSWPTNNSAPGDLPVLQAPSAVRYQALTWLTVAAALSYLCRNAVGVAESTIREEMGLTLEQSGWFMGAFFWTYALFQVPSGWFSQRQGTRIGLTAFALGWSVATLGIGIAPGFWLLIVAQLVMSIAQAGIFPAVNECIRQTIYTILGGKININPCKNSRLCLADTPCCRILIV